MKPEIFVGLNDISRAYVIYKDNRDYLSPEKVLKYVSSKSKISVEKLASKSRDAELSKYRHCYVWLYRQLMLKKGYMTTMDRNTQMPAQYRAKFATESKVAFLIGRNRTTSINAWQSFENRLLTDKELKKNAYEWLEELNKIL